MILQKWQFCWGGHRVRTRIALQFAGRSSCVAVAQQTQQCGLSRYRRASNRAQWVVRKFNHLGTTVPPLTAVLIVTLDGWFSERTAAETPQRPPLATDADRVDRRSIDLTRPTRPCTSSAVRPDGRSLGNVRLDCAGTNEQ